MTDCFLQGGCSPDVEPLLPLPPVAPIIVPEPGLFDLPTTGMDVLLLILLALTFVAVGTLCVAVARRWL